MEEDLSRFCCQHPECPDYGKRGHGNLTVCGRYGKAKQHRLLYCRTCKARFSERKGTPLFGCCLPEDKAIDVWKHLSDRNGVRATARLVGVHRDTVVRYSRRVGEHSQQLHDEFVAFPPWTEEVQFDEKWSFVAKKQEHCDPLDPADANHGEWWDHTAYDPEHRLVLSVVPGAREAERRGRGRRRQAADGGPAHEAFDQRRLPRL